MLLLSIMTKIYLRGFNSGLRVLCCHANKHENANNCWFLGTFEHDEFHA